MAIPQFGPCWVAYWALDYQKKKQEGVVAMLCVIAKLNHNAVERLRALQNAAASFGIRPAPVYGHVTIATYTPDDDTEFIMGCKELLQNIGPFSVFFDKIEVLSATSIIVATPQKAGVLMSLHDRLAARYGPFLDQWTCGDSWYPHTTLLYHPQADLASICRSMQEIFSPFEAAVNGIEFSKVTEAGYRITDRITL